MVGPLFVYALLESIKISKRIFSLELEIGKEALIHDCLGQKHLPQSYQYYDCIQDYIRRHVSSEQKMLVLMKNQKNKLLGKSFKEDGTEEV
mmetsp:Transcript_4377/g.6354  ORF Transcript_4377/g.6354 Transcript_4377/m.6354 type:complete len:91 (-) Transcript_4377:1609-1881(-)